MKFIKLESRGGNYLVVAENIAWLRTAENGQTNVGMVGGQPLLVVGSIEEVAEKILNATRNEEQPAAPVSAATGPVASAPTETAPQVAANPAPSTPPANNGPENVPAIDEEAAPEPEPEPEPEAVAPNPEKIALAPQSAPATPSASESTPHDPSPAIVRLTNRNPVPLWERSAPRTAANTATPRVKAGSQRFMGKLD